jgi:uncharacterized repeat protein (TIGR02543 family)
MGRRVGSTAALLLLFLLALGVASAGGRTLAVTTVTVEVIGRGTVTSEPVGVNCGNSAKACHIAFSGSGTVTLTATPATDWTFGSWDSCPSAPVGNTCEVPVDGNAYEVTANFDGPPTTTSTLSVTYSGDGSVSGGDIDCGSAPPGTDCTWTVLTGSTLTVLEEPDAGNVFSGWSGACTGTSVACTVTMDGDRSINASWASSTETALLAVSISGGGTVQGGGISCPSTCTATEALNSSVTLTASAGEGYTFTGWSGACSGSAPTCTFTMDADKTVAATFAAAPQLVVTVTGNGNVSGGSGAINCGNNGNVCSARFSLNSTVTLTASPATGATFLGWSGACGGTATTCTVLMSESKSVSATFSAGPPVLLSVSVTGGGTVTGGGISCGNGATTCNASVPANSSVVLTATPASGATFTGWGGACSGTATTCTVSMTSAKSVSATFSGGTPSTFLLSVSVTGRGAVTGGGISCGNGATTCSASVTANSSVVLTATAGAGGKFTGWSGACTGTTRTCTVTLNLAKTVTATFSGGVSVLTSLGSPRIKRSGTKFLVTLRFKTPLTGTARVRALRAGRSVTTLSRRVAAGAATVGPFTVATSGLYTFELELGGRTIRWRTCLGRCGAAAPGPDFVLTRKTPTTTRNGDVWSVTLHLRANLISDARVRAYRGTVRLVDKHFLASKGEVVLGPFLLGPGRYSVRLTATDGYGRVRTLTWIVSLAR